jgi:hypothetical protein
MQTYKHASTAFPANTHASSTSLHGWFQEPRESKASIGDDSVSTFRIVDFYGPMLQCEFFGADDLVVVEVPWLKVLKRLPDPMYRAKFGT